MAHLDILQQASKPRQACNIYVQICSILFANSYVIIIVLWISSFFYDLDNYLKVITSAGNKFYKKQIMIIKSMFCITGIKPWGDFQRSVANDEIMKNGGPHGIGG